MLSAWCSTVLAATHGTLLCLRPMKPTPLPLPPDLPPADERARLAAQMAINPTYLYQLVTGRREMDPADAVLLERRSGLRIRRWHLRRRTWHLVWPELIGAEGAPDPCTAEAVES